MSSPGPGAREFHLGTYWVRRLSSHGPATGKSGQEVCMYFRVGNEPFLRPSTFLSFRNLDPRSSTNISLRFGLCVAFRVLKTRQHGRNYRPHFTIH